MRATSSPPDNDLLFSIAEAQQGFFTMAQALEAGFARSTHSYHVKAGNWTREHRGIYRLRRYPASDEGQLVLWSLWSRDRSGKPQGVYSHETALALRELSDVNPPKLHMTVPPGFRRNSEIPGALVLHRAKLPDSEIERDRGYALTRPMRAIVDCAAAGTDPDLLRQALEQGLKRGLITRSELKRARELGEHPD
jgi:predicted transcriptional regulator of viral defense system